MKILNEKQGINANNEIVLPNEQNFSEPASEDADHPDEQVQEQRDLEPGQD